MHCSPNYYTRSTLWLSSLKTDIVQMIYQRVHDYTVVLSYIKLIVNIIKNFILKNWNFIDRILSFCTLQWITYEVIILYRNYNIYFNSSYMKLHYVLFIFQSSYYVHKLDTSKFHSFIIKSQKINIRINTGRSILKRHLLCT